MPVYLDYNATAPMRREAAERMQALLGQPMNPSSVHAAGRAAKKVIEDARAAIAQRLNAWPNEIVFTASGTEANNTILRAFPDRQVMVSAIEHASVLRAANPELIPVLPNGVVDLAALERMLKDSKQSVLLSVMLANNETGVIQPVKEIARIAHAQGALLHCDAVQGLGKIPVDFTDLGVDALTLSAHKIGGPQGAAALVVRNTLAFAPLLKGGGQELGRRAGTENVAAIAGFHAAIEQLGNLDEQRGWLDAMEAELLAYAPEAVMFGKDMPRLPNTTLIAMPGVSSETQLMHFDLTGIAVSAGSACSSGRVTTSHVLLAMGVEESIASSAVRVSGGWATSQADLRAFAQSWKQLYDRVAKKAA